MGSWTRHARRAAAKIIGAARLAIKIDRVIRLAHQAAHAPRKPEQQGEVGLVFLVAILRIREDALLEGGTRVVRLPAPQVTQAEVEGVHRLLVRIAGVVLAALAADDRSKLFAATYLPVTHHTGRAAEVFKGRVHIAHQQFALCEHVENQCLILDWAAGRFFTRKVGDHLNIAADKAGFGKLRLPDGAGRVGQQQ